jgi:hypothetical protein
MFIEIVGIDFDNDVWRDKAINISPLRGCFPDRVLKQGVNKK